MSPIPPNQVAQSGRFWCRNIFRLPFRREGIDDSALHRRGWSAITRLRAPQIDRSERSLGMTRPPYPWRRFFPSPPGNKGGSTNPFCKIYFKFISRT